MTRLLVLGGALAGTLFLLGGNHMTSVHRTALGAGGSVSTRQAQQMRDDEASPEIIPVRQVTSSASVGMEQGVFSRVRDRQVVTEAMKPEPPRPKTASELAGEAGLAEHKERQAREAAAEARAYATGRKVDGYQRMIDEAKAKVAAEALRQRKTQHEFLENAVIREAEDLTPDETRVFWEKLVAMNCCLDVGAASVVAMEIRASRKA